MAYDYWLLIGILGTSMFLSVRLGKLDFIAAITGGLLGFLIFLGAGYIGLALIGTFFILGTAATSWKLKTKESTGLSETNKGKRTMGQVLANAGTAGILGLISYKYPDNSELLVLMIAASFAAAASDTLSSELGNVYGKRFVNIISLKRDTRGLNGVVSLEGTCFGIAGSVVIAFIYAIGFEWNEHFFWIVAGGTAGNVVDSILGATLERKGLLGNNAVNFLNTLTGALVAMALYFL